MSRKLTTDTDLTSIANAIRAKGGTSASLAYPTGFVSAIEAIKTNNESVPANAVNFRDYDGTIVQSYSAVDFAALTAMPNNPSHNGLTAQGWNWSLADAKAYVAKYGKLEIGQMYITDDGKTRVYIHLEQGRTSPMLGVCPNGTVDVDWGDGTTHDTLTGTSTSTVQWTPNHAYSAPGDYVIKLTVTGSMGFYWNYSNNQFSGLLQYTSSSDSRNCAYRNAIQRVEIGSNVTSINDGAFYYCSSLTNITIPNSITGIGDYAFYYCSSLTNITISDSVRYISNDVFYSCSSLANITIPNSVRNIGSRVFSGTNLASITIPDSVKRIDDYMFNYCLSLVNITIPDSITEINYYAFNSCFSVAEYHFVHTIPPTLSNTNAFGDIPADCIIYVPYSADHSILNAYKTASNWSTYASYIQEELQ